MDEAGETGSFSGTPLYLAPEVLAGGAATVASDVYGLGVLLYYLASGEYPVRADSLDALREAHRAGPPTPLTEKKPEVPRPLCEVVDRAVADDPAQRWPDMECFQRALERRDQPGSGGWKYAWLAAAVLLLVAFLWPRPETAPAFMVDTDLYRVTQDGRVALQAGADVALGDRLSLVLTTDTPLYVYVFNEDQAGNAHGLFPLTWLTQKNPLPAGAGHELPGVVGSPTMAWQVDRAGGLEKIHIIASPEPLVELEALYADLPPATLANPVLSQRGVGTVAPVGPTVSAAPLVQAARQLTGRSSEVSGAWFHTIELQGPAPR